MGGSVAGTVELLANAEACLQDRRGVIGLDGFVDKIIRVVASEDSDGNATYVKDIPQLAARIGRAAGKSTALELHVQQQKLGGNGPIMANALATFGLDLTYVGSVGTKNNVNVVFQAMAEKCRMVPVCKPARTDALEFEDGKLMLQQMEVLDILDYELIQEAAGGAAALLALFEDANFLALNHWSSLPHMSAIWKQLQAEICPQLSDRPREAFFDLADPEKRNDQDVREALELIAGFEEWYAVTLGLNQKESEQIARVLGCEPQIEDARERDLARSKAIQAELGISCVAVHPVAYAAAAGPEEAAVVDGPHCPKPLITTGAGDHFNAGFSFGKILGGTLEQCLQLGVATSGFYVRTAKSPTAKDLKEFVASL